jgi:rSAM/selenodomain-associated transferase 2
MLSGISIIIPALNEAEALGAALESAEGAAVTEVILVDGGSEDETVQLARSHGANVASAPRGRASQMNAGARMAKADILLFLHADTRLPSGFAEEVRHVLAEPGVVAGAFSLRIEGEGKRLRWIERLANWRSRVLQLPYGDQGLFVKEELFRSIGGFPEIPLMEDVELVRRLWRRGRIAVSPLHVVTSARRWERAGVLRATLLNQFFLFSYFLGMPSHRIARWYYPQHKTQTQDSKT